MTTLLWILVYVGLFYFMFRYGGCCGGHGSHSRHRGHDTEGEHRSHEGHRATMSTTTDPVCGKAVSEEDGFARRYNGHAYRFCSEACLARFEEELERYSVEERIAS